MLKIRQWVNTLAYIASDILALSDPLHDLLATEEDISGSWFEAEATAR